MVGMGYSGGGLCYLFSSLTSSNPNLVDYKEGELMPKLGQHTPITDEEAEDWARRMIRDAEDLDEIWNADEWEEFTFMKLGIEKGSFPSPAARDVLTRGRSFLTGELIEAGISTQVVYPRPGIPQTVIRDPLGRFISWGAAKRAL